MIRSFRSKALRLFFSQGDRSRLSVRGIARLERILEQLDQARELDDMRRPGFRLHALSGQAAGRYAVDASANWRLTFAWTGEDAEDVDLEDYH